MITVHHLEYSQSIRMIWLMEELGEPYELKLYDRDKTTFLAPAEYKAISPLGSAPVITDGDLTLAESNAIADYILDKYPNDRLRPPAGSENRNRHLFWFHASQGSMMPIMLMDTLLRAMETRAPFLVRPIAKSISGQMRNGFLDGRMKALLKTAEKDLGEKPWFGGDDVTLADIIMCYNMEGASKRGYFDPDYPNCAAWMQRLYARPAYQTALSKTERDQAVFSV